MDRHKTHTTTVRLEPQDRQAIETIKDLYGVGSDVAAIRLALRMTARQEVRAKEEVSEPEPMPVPEIKAYKTDLAEPEPPLHFPGVTREQVEAVVEPAPMAAQPAPTSTLRQPIYQIYLKHALGTCPALPDGFDYIDGDQSTGKRSCTNPVHRVFAQPTTLEAARRRAGELQVVIGVTRVWIEDRKGGQKDSWSKENGRWVRDN
jgi:hypothetical protein